MLFHFTVFIYSSVLLIVLSVPILVFGVYTRPGYSQKVYPWTLGIHYPRTPDSVRLTPFRDSRFFTLSVLSKNIVGELEITG